MITPDRRTPHAGNAVASFAFADESWTLSQRLGSGQIVGAQSHKSNPVWPALELFAAIRAATSLPGAMIPQPTARQKETAGTVRIDPFHSIVEERGVSHHGISLAPPVARRPPAQVFADDRPISYPHHWSGDDWLDIHAAGLAALAFYLIDGSDEDGRDDALHMSRSALGFVADAIGVTERVLAEAAARIFDWIRSGAGAKAYTRAKEPGERYALALIAKGGHGGVQDVRTLIDRTAYEELRYLAAACRLDLDANADMTKTSRGAETFRDTPQRRPAKSPSSAIHPTTSTHFLPERRPAKRLSLRPPSMIQPMPTHAQDHQKHPCPLYKSMR